MTQVYSPRPYQRAMIEHMLEHSRCALFAPMGCGKTSTVLTALDLQYTAGTISRPTLVVGPKRVALHTWPSEARKWQHLSGLEVVPVIGDLKTRKAALSKDAPIFTTNYEQLPWLVEHYDNAWPFGQVIADESTRLKGFRLRQGTCRARALGRIAHKYVDYWTNLTGTPAPNGLQDLWGQTWFLDKGRRLGSTFDAFRTRWFRPDWSGYGIEPLPHAQSQIEEFLRDICMTVDMQLPVDEPTVVRLEVELPSEAMAQYKRFEKEMFIELEGKELEAFNAAALSNKCLQLANGAAYVESNGGPQHWAEVHDAKLQALDSLLQELCGAPLLVAYHFKADLARIRKAFPYARVLDDDPQTIDDWNAGRIPLLLAHPQSAGHGLNLQDGGCHAAVFGHWWDAELYEQFIERIGPLRQLQSGHPRPVTIYHIVAMGTLDEVVIERRDTKCSVQQALLNAMKRK